MRITLHGVLLVVAWCNVAGSAVAASPPAEAAVRATVERQADAWNRHDAKAYAALFATDADVVNVVGWWWQGRAQLEAKLTQAYSRMFKNSALTFTDVQVRFLDPRTAIAHARWTMTGATPPPGMPEPKAGIQTLVLRKHAGHWLIDVFQNTNAIAEVAFGHPPQVANPPKP
jgi:uncharacterized protein (TIGR02246 family)